jgi:DNA-binding XRE family transcriptional regulator
MPNFAQSLKSEIIRLSRKEIKVSVPPLRRSNINFKKSVAELKKKVTSLETENKRLLALYNKTQSQVSPEAAKKVRITSKSIKKLRAKLGLSQESFAKLIGVSSQAVYAMEHKDGRMKLRTNTLANLLSARGMGKREAKKRVEEIEE